LTWCGDFLILTGDPHIGCDYHKKNLKTKRDSQDIRTKGCFLFFLIESFFIFIFGLIRHGRTFVSLGIKCARGLLKWLEDKLFKRVFLNILRSGLVKKGFLNILRSELFLKRIF
jgi:hypothetical protein